MECPPFAQESLALRISESRIFCQFTSFRWRVVGWTLSPILDNLSISCCIIITKLIFNSSNYNGQNFNFANLCYLLLPNNKINRKALYFISDKVYSPTYLIFNIGITWPLTIIYFGIRFFHLYCLTWKSKFYITYIS